MEKITLGAEASLVTPAVWVAENKDYFQENELEVDIKTFESGKRSFPTMLEGGDVDLSTVAPTPIMFNSSKRDDLSVPATFVYCEEV